MQVREDIESPIVLLELTTENGGISMGGPSGEITFYMDAVQTAAIQWTSGVYDVEFILPGPAPRDVQRRIKGTVMVSPEITR